MRKGYLGIWLLLWASAAVASAWVVSGEAYARRHLFGPVQAPEVLRTRSQFVAIMFPRISEDGERFTLSERDLRHVLVGLRKRGYVSIGLRDVADFYEKGRALPPKAVLIGFDRDHPGSIELADRALRKSRMRGVVFMEPVGEGLAKRRSLSAHAVSQMLKSGAWDFGSASAERPAGLPETDAPAAWLLPEGEQAASLKEKGLRFTVSELGYNDELSRPDALRALAIAPERGPEETIRVIESTWPRASPFSDGFEEARLGADWIPGWGVVSAAKGRLAILPAPRHTGAAVMLRGTERWRDQAVEVELRKHRREFWVYARYTEGGPFIRVGARDGFWQVEQKAGPKNPVRLLGRAAIAPGGLPARLRFVLKEDWAILHVDGRMQFGKALRMHPAISRGRLQLGVYDAKPHAAMALVGSVAARPLGRDWIALEGEGIAEGFDERRLSALREEAVQARAISPRWIRISPTGGISLAEDPLDLIRSLAGFYRCELVPMAELPARGAELLQDPAAARRLQEALTAAAEDLESVGLNMRLSREDAARPETARFLAGLRRSLNASRRTLWATLPEPALAEDPITQAVDGVLIPAKRAVPTLALLTHAE